MIRRGTHIIIAFTVLLSCIKSADAQQRNLLVITGDHLVLQLDLQSPRKSLDSILEVAGIGAQHLEKILKGDFASLKNDGWSMSIQQNAVIRFDKPLSDLDENPQDKPYLITTRLKQFGGKPGYPAQVKYGINRYRKITVFELSSGLTRFILPGYQGAKRVILSGSFNNWSTLKGLMIKTEGGWILDVKLEPGAYEYKYIIDGGWRTDPSNLLDINDGAGNINSIYFKYNYTFKLTGHSSAHRVTVAGDFNKWDANEIIMEKKGNVWERQMYLDDEVHKYRFMIDAKWVTDLANPHKLSDNSGNVSSVLNLGAPVYFKLAGYPNAKNVFVAGNFNDWKPDDLSLKNTRGVWMLQIALPAGNYNYKFIVDGEWITDPQNPYRAVENGKVNSFLSVRPNHTFKLKGSNSAKKVTLNGSFNNWEPSGFTMAHTGDEWHIEFYLKPGKYLYKFRIDGSWIIDPGNKLWEQNQFGTGNSVLWVE